MPITAPVASAATIAVAVVIVIVKLGLRSRRGVAQNPAASITDCLTAAALVPFVLLGSSPVIPGQAEVLFKDMSLQMALAGIIAFIHMTFQLSRL